MTYRMRKAYVMIKKTRQMLKKSHDMSKSYYDKGTSKPNIKVGSKVYIQKHIKDGPLHKVSAKFEGPFRVVEVLKLNKYKLINVDTGDEKIAHWNHLKIIKHDVGSWVKENEVSSTGNNKVEMENEKMHERVSHSSPYNLRSRIAAVQGELNYKSN